jgi:hypothetical protein
MSQPAEVLKRIQAGVIFKQCFYNPHVKAVVAQIRMEAVERRMAIEKVKE